MWNPHISTISTFRMFISEDEGVNAIDVGGSWYTLNESKALLNLRFSCSRLSTPFTTNQVQNLTF